MTQKDLDEAKKKYPDAMRSKEPNFNNGNWKKRYMDTIKRYDDQNKKYIKDVCRLEEKVIKLESLCGSLILAIIILCIIIISLTLK